MTQETPKPIKPAPRVLSTDSVAIAGVCVVGTNVRNQKDQGVHLVMYLCVQRSLGNGGEKTLEIEIAQNIRYYIDLDQMGGSRNEVFHKTVVRQGWSGVVLGLPWN